MLLKIGLPQTIFFHVANLGWFWGSPILRNFKEMHHPLDHGWPSQKKAASNTYERTFLKLVGQCGSLTNLSCRLHERLTSGPNWPVFLKPFHVHFITMKKLSCCNVRAEKITKLSPHQVHPHGLWHHSQAMKEKRTYFKPAMTVFNHTTIYELCNISADFWWFNPVISQLPPPSKWPRPFPMANFWWTHLFSKPLAGRVVI